MNYEFIAIPDAEVPLAVEPVLQRERIWVYWPRVLQPGSFRGEPGISRDR